MTEVQSPAEQFFSKCQEMLSRVAEQREVIASVAERFAQTIASGRMVHLFGSGHSRIMIEEIWPRYGSFPGFHPMVELSLTYHNSVVGSNGQRQAMFLENISGFAERILRNYQFNKQDSALVVSLVAAMWFRLRWQKAFSNAVCSLRFC